jgi:hypothetical protein
MTSSSEDVEGPAERNRYEVSDSMGEELVAATDRAVALARQLFERRTGLSWEDVIESDQPRDQSTSA